MSDADFSPVEESDTPAEVADAVISAISAHRAAPVAAEPSAMTGGHITLTHVNGHLVAVTRQDDEHRILSILWQKSDDAEQVPASQAAPVAAVNVTNKS